MVLTATTCFRWRWRALYTVPMPPPPIRSSSWYRPRTTGGAGSDGVGDCCQEAVRAFGPDCFVSGSGKVSLRSWGERMRDDGDEHDQTNTAPGLPQGKAMPALRVAP